MIARSKSKRDGLSLMRVSMRDKACAGKEPWAGRGNCRAIDTSLSAANYLLMNEMIYPRSPRETMCGWTHLPRFIDKIRLHLAGKLHGDYSANFCKGFDGLWLEMSGVKADEFIEVVKKSITDGQVC